jgi:glutamate dehydrogenase
VIDSILKMMRKDKVEAEGLEVFSALLFASTLSKRLAGIEPKALAAFALQAFRHTLKKPHKRHSIGFTTTTLLGSPGDPPATVLEILNDDMPYVVESVICALHAEGLIPQLVFHPIFKVKRYGAGRLQAVVGPGDRHWSSGDQESYIAVVFDPLDAERQQRLAETLEAVLDDVRAASVDGDQMRTRITQAISSYETIQLGLTPPPGAPGPLELKEAADLLRWLGQGNFTLLGMREFEVVGLDDKIDLWPTATGALGIGRTDASAGSLRPAPSEAAMTQRIREIYAAPSALIFFKSAITSRVRRRVPLDCIGVKRYTPAGKLIGELRLYGLFTPASSMHPVETIPVIRHKVRRVLSEAQFPPESHNARTLIDILENFPRDELLQIEPALLHDWSMRLLDLSIRPRPAVLTRRDDLGNYTSALVFVPREHYSSAVRERIGTYIADRFGGVVTAYYPYISSSLLVRAHLIIAGARPAAQPPTAQPQTVQPPTSELATDEFLERGVVEIIKTWDERLDEAIAKSAARIGNPDAATAFRGAFSNGYAESFSVERAVEDIARIARLGPTLPVAIDFYRAEGAPAHRVRAAVYRYDEPIALSERVPVLENMGFRVIDESSYRVRPRLGEMRREVVLHDMELETADGNPLDLATHETRMEDVFLAVFRADAESDLFNALVISAGLDWREAAVIRALSAFQRQMRSPFSPRYVAETLLRHAAIARDLYAIFRTRFADPAAAASEAREAKVAELRQSIETALSHVQSLDEDRILRRFVGVLLAVLRTNAFQVDSHGRPPAVVAFKLASREIERLPDPKPYREIFVYSPRVEGVHLRFAPIARGGIRWSDRAQDYRTEVLGLAKAQQVKNSVIVPSGAKGGFVLKQVKRNATREETQAEGIACYRLFIEALLSLTDDIRSGKVVPPAGVVRRDGDDPYLVVAADKGTATFSDYANAISMERGFWLGDAFASGGSSGYDHKRLGITARGAWECVKRHFREMDIDIQRQPFRVVGVGDMSGDVFGNGMLLSPMIKLVAAFDHRDIFIDPDPDPAVTFAERKRLFDLPRSSWADYDRTKISAGGGVFSRAAKSVALAPEVRAALGIDAPQMTPAELIQAILSCETDLLWFGGIGTFVRETGETDDQAGDRANDALRVAASELRAKVIGEGANLGVTQRGRIEAAHRGIRLNTDFIDNSAGVNTSDEEVNIKIALEPALLAGRLSRQDRDRLLATMASVVAASVLENNHAQSLALSLAERASRKDLAGYILLTRRLEERGLIDRKLEALPSGAEMSARAKEGKGLTRPELAVLLSWSKLALNADVLASTLPDGAEAESLFDYFPPVLRESHRSEIAAHRLSREIVAIGITNAIVDTGGPDIMMRLANSTGEPVSVLADAYLAARSIFDIAAAWRELDGLDGKIAGSLQLHLYQALQHLQERETMSLLASRRGRSMAEMIAAYRPAARELAAEAPAILPAGRRHALSEAAARLQSAGVPPGIASRHAALGLAEQVMPLADLAANGGAGVGETARVLFARDDFLHIDDLRKRTVELAPADDFDRQVIERSRAIVERAARSIGERMLADPAARGVSVQAWAAANASSLLVAEPIIEKALADPGFSVARLDIIADALRDVN